MAKNKSKFSPISFKEIESFLKKRPFKFIGNKKNVLIKHIKPLHEIENYGLSWVKRNAEDIPNSIANKNGLILINEKTEVKKLPKKSNYLLVDNPKLIFAELVNHFWSTKKQGIDPGARISELARIGKNVFIGPNVIIGDCKIGNNVILHGNIYIYDNVTIGDNCIIHAGCIIGAPGSGYVKNAQGEWTNFPQIGRTVIEKNVEVGALTYITKGALGETRIKSGAKIGLASCIGHNVTIGKNAMLTANLVVGGGAIVEDDVWVSMGALIRNGVKLGNSSFIGMGAVVTKNVEPGTTVLGNPAKPVVRKNSI